MISMSIHIYYLGILFRDNRKWENILDFLLINKTQINLFIYFFLFIYYLFIYLFIFIFTFLFSVSQIVNKL